MSVYLPTKRSIVSVQLHGYTKRTRQGPVGSETLDTRVHITTDKAQELSRLLLESTELVKLAQPAYPDAYWYVHVEAKDADGVPIRLSIRIGD